MNIKEFDYWLENNYILNPNQKKDIISMYKIAKKRHMSIKKLEDLYIKIGLEYEVAYKIINYILYPQKRYEKGNKRKII